ncbi:MAG TPA: T9SS type A sorting domain-containing protein, partial [Chitinophagales bacterium]|nr:T9SS type A sorting domain-containing protein [Chitinophagales bacterium]
IANIEIVTPVGLPGEYYLWTLPAGWNIASGDSTNVIYAVSGTTGGTVSVVIENVCGASQPVTKNVTVVPSNLGAAGTITGPADLCPGQQVSYSINPVQGAGSYVWTLPQGWSTTGSSNNTISATNGSTGGVIQVSAANSCGTSQPATINVTVTTAPVISTPVTGPAEVCAGQQAQFSVPAIAGADEYNWTLPAGWQVVSVADTNVIDATAGSAGTIQVTAGNQCGTSSAAELSVTINTAPVVNGTIQGPDTICAGAGEGIYYVINPMPSAGNTYDWTLPNGWSFIGGDSTMSPIVNITSSGTLSVVASNQCGAGTQLSYAVALVDTPVAQLTLSGTTLTASPAGAGYTYQWFLNDQLVTGETGSTLQATGEGVYKVTVSNQWFCSSTATVNYVLGLSGVSEAAWRIYPNPSTGLLYIVTDAGMQGGVIKILAADGRLVYNSSVIGTQTAIWLPQIGVGIYTISLQKGATVLHQKLVKQ